MFGENGNNERQGVTKSCLSSTSPEKGPQTALVNPSAPVYLSGLFRLWQGCADSTASCQFFAKQFYVPLKTQPQNMANFSEFYS